MTKKESIQSALKSSYSFQSYLELIEKLHQEEKATSFQDNIEFYNYSLLGLKRMKRVYKTTKLSEDVLKIVQNIDHPQTWLLITESWCGDASQTVPTIVRIAEENDLIDLRIVLRDSNLKLMEYYLTNGGISIPILAVLDENLDQNFKWGPRPEPAQSKIIAYKKQEEPKPPYSEISLEIQKWYNSDKGITTQQELYDLLRMSL